MTRRIAITVQRDLVGDLAGYVLVLVAGSDRTPLEECDTLGQANDRARALILEHHCTSIEIDDVPQGETA